MDTEAWWVQRVKHNWVTHTHTHTRTHMYILIALSVIPRKCLLSLFIFKWYKITIDRNALQKSIHITLSFNKIYHAPQKPWKVIEYSHFTSPDLSFFLLCFGLCLRRLTFLEFIRGLPCLLASVKFLPMGGMGRRSEYIHIPAFLPTSLLMVGCSCIPLWSL